MRLGDLDVALADLVLTWTWTTSTSALFQGYGTIVGPGHWFEQSDRSFRLGFGWPTIERLEEGLAALSAATSEQLR